MALYSEKVMDHFTNPRNVGKIEDADGIGEVGNAKCGDIMKMYIKVSDDGIIEDVKINTFGCASAIASSSMATEMISLLISQLLRRLTVCHRLKFTVLFWRKRQLRLLLKIIMIKKA